MARKKAPGVDRPLTLETVQIEDLVLDNENPRLHTDGGIQAIARSLDRFGQRTPIVLAADSNLVLKGNGTVKAAKLLGWSAIQAVRAPLKGREARAYTIADNRTAELNAWETGRLRSQVIDLRLNLPDFDRLRLDLSFGDRGKGGKRKPHADMRDDNAPPADPVTKAGDLWELGQHRLLCGDSRRPDHVQAATAGEKISLLLTDPPYCSGSFQEAGRGAGTWGSIASDNLSTKGWRELMTQVLAATNPGTVYVFTDWRQWGNLWEVSESSGLPVRGMLVWDKETPALGTVWRQQFELILWATREAQKKTAKTNAASNLLRCKRTGNANHYTEKPVDLLTRILENDARAGRGGVSVVDPFLGSGSTLLSAEAIGRPCYGLEIEPGFCDVTVQRWEEATGKKAKRTKSHAPA